VRDYCDRKGTLRFRNDPHYFVNQCFFPSAQLCKALLDRVTDRAHIIETGSDSYRFKRTVEKKKRKL
jgi:hypothetical protein